MIWFTSDNHFGHEKIVGYCGRPDDHEARMLEGWNCVEPGDTLVHLGDIVFRRNRRDVHAFLDQHLPQCERRIFCEGNHDKKTRPRTWPHWDHVTRYHNVHELLLDGVTVAMSHRPQDLGREKTAIVLHGHIHEIGSPWRWRNDQLWVNVCVEQWDYRPVSWATIHEVWKLRLPSADVSSIDPAQRHEERRPQS